jgi:hypothetical protein
MYARIGAKLLNVIEESGKSFNDTFYLFTYMLLKNIIGRGGIVSIN